MIGIPYPTQKEAYNAVKFGITDIAYCKGFKFEKKPNGTIERTPVESKPVTRANTLSSINKTIMNMQQRLDDMEAVLKGGR